MGTINGTPIIQYNSRTRATKLKSNNTNQKEKKNPYRSNRETKFPTSQLPIQALESTPKQQKLEKPSFSPNSHQTTKDQIQIQSKKKPN